MASANFYKNSDMIAGRVDLEESSFPVSLSDLSPDGCQAQATKAWGKNGEFLQLTILGQIQICGRVLSRDGRNATIGFFGQLHPDVIKQMGQVAA